MSWPAHFYPTDDADQGTETLRIEQGGNDDWYLTVLASPTDKIGPTVRITTSGARREHRHVAMAVFRLHQALAGKEYVSVEHVGEGAAREALAEVRDLLGLQPGESLKVAVGELLKVVKARAPALPPEMGILAEVAAEADRRAGMPMDEVESRWRIMAAPPEIRLGRADWVTIGALALIMLRRQESKP